MMPCANRDSSRCRSVLTIAAFTVFLFAASDGHTQDSCAKLVEDVVKHELDMAPAQGRWMYTAAFRKDGVQHRSRRIETDDGILTWDIERNGSPLTDQEKTAQRAEFERLISSREQLERNRKAMRDDYAKINRMLSYLPVDLQFTCVSQDADTTTIRFEPKPGIAPWDVEERVIAGMSGTLRLNPVEMRLLTADGSLQKDLSMFLGLARIHKGSSVLLKREPTASGAWETTRVSLHISGQVLFLKTIAQDRDEVRSEFCPVRKGLTARDALAYLTGPFCPSS